MSNDREENETTVQSESIFLHNSSWNNPVPHGFSNAPWQIRMDNGPELLNVLIFFGTVGDVSFFPAPRGLQLAPGAESLMSFSRRKPQTSRPLASRIGRTMLVDRKRFQRVVEVCDSRWFIRGMPLLFPSFFTSSAHGDFIVVDYLLFGQLIFRQTQGRGYRLHLQADADGALETHVHRWMLHLGLEDSTEWFISVPNSINLWIEIM